MQFCVPSYDSGKLNIWLFKQSCIVTSCYGLCQKKVLNPACSILLDIFYHEGTVAHVCQQIGAHLQLQLPAL